MKNLPLIITVGPKEGENFQLGSFIKVGYEQFDHRGSRSILIYPCDRDSIKKVVQDKQYKARVPSSLDFVSFSEGREVVLHFTEETSGCLYQKIKISFG